MIAAPTAAPHRFLGFAPDLADCFLWDRQLNARRRTAPERHGKVPAPQIIQFAKEQGRCGGLADYHQFPDNKPMESHGCAQPAENQEKRYPWQTKRKC